MRCASPHAPAGGVTRDYVIGMTVVLADGRVAKLGRTTAKGVTGYDFVGLMVGSEGTLGIVVDVTVSLLPLGDARSGLSSLSEQSESKRAPVSAPRCPRRSGAPADRSCRTATAPR
jgi:FAD/FMN-containing dehydrogenase